MKKLVVYVFLLVSFAGYGQETITLSTRQFERYQQIQLASLDGWLFRQGTDSTWANESINLSHWRKLKPIELTAKLADENGRVEGWFRIHIQLDSSFKAIPLGMSRQLWAATDVYKDGNLIQTFGNTGTPYEAYNPILRYSRPISLMVGRKHLIAIHFVNYESLFTQRELRLAPQNLRNIIALTGPDYDYYVTGKVKEAYVLGSITIAISSLLLFLFMLLLFLNTDQKIFQLASLLTFAVLLSAIGTYYRLFYHTSYDAEKLTFLITNGLTLPVMNVLTLLVTEWVLKKRVSLITILILFIMPFTSLLGHLFNISWPFGLVNGALLIYFGYLVITCWKKIRIAEWTVLIAMAVLTLTAMVWVALHKYSPDNFSEFEYPLKTIVLLSAPTMLLVYVSLSYKEIWVERVEETKKVIRITEEKKVLAERQNEILEAEVKQRTSALEKSLSDLKSTQSQLIQSEKMASLGELTAGIAHEIQNPLNFVNNFSEVNTELIDELEHEANKGNLEEVKTLAKDIKDNEQKINHHGKRADAIVKGMLQHSRSSSGVKEPVDINALADEYLRLAYHGLRAKDKSFNANLKTDFDQTIGNINVIPHDIGRVILNLITNAFYAVNEKKGQGPNAFEPTVTVRTKRMADKVLISVKDNGPGIPQKVLDKIFQPFFTTKPAGHGTGLGLSLSYDIVKAHGGELKVETLPAGLAGREGEGSEFTIVLPIV